MRAQGWWLVALLSAVGCARAPVRPAPAETARLTAPGTFYFRVSPQVGRIRGQVVRERATYGKHTTDPDGQHVTEELLVGQLGQSRPRRELRRLAYDPQAMVPVPTVVLVMRDGTRTTLDHDLREDWNGPLEADDDPAEGSDVLLGGGVDVTRVLKNEHNLEVGAVLYRIRWIDEATFEAARLRLKLTPGPSR